MRKILSLICVLVFIVLGTNVAFAQNVTKANIVKKSPVAVEQLKKTQPVEGAVKQDGLKLLKELKPTPLKNADNLQKLNKKVGAKTPIVKGIVKANHGASLARTPNTAAGKNIGKASVKNGATAKPRSIASKRQATPKAYSTTYNYKCGPTEVVVTDLSTPTYNQFKLVITQKAKNTAEYSKTTLYDNTVELILNPDEHSIVGTFTSDDYSIDVTTFVKSGSNTRYVSYLETSTITIESKGGNKYAITDGLLQVENSSGSYLYKYDYCYAAADLNDQTAAKTPFEFTFGEEPTPEDWKTIGESSVKDGVVAYLLGDTKDAAAYNVTTSQKGTSYKMKDLFGKANPAYNKIKDLATYKSTEITIDATDANNVKIAKQNIGWTGVLLGEIYEIEASNGKLANGVITFAAADIKFYEDGTAPYTGYGDLVITLPSDEPSQDINVTALQWQYDDYYYDVYIVSENTTYLFELAESTGGLEYGKTYTYADMYSQWVGTLDSYGYIDVAATDATLTVTKDQDGLIHIVATMVLDGVTHNIKYDDKPFAPSGVQINVNGTDLTDDYLSAYGFYLYTAKWGDYTVQLPFNVTEEKATYTNDDFNAQYGLIYSNTEEIYLQKLASDITITTTNTTKTLTGSVYAKNGDEYILNLVYEKPDAKEININVKDATLTNRITGGGCWTIDGQTADNNNSFKIYFISKGLQGTFTDVEQFYSYDTWVTDKSTGSNVFYENLSAVNLTSTIVGDSLVVEGTLSLADSKGNPANVTVHISTPFTQTWGEWADFAPFDKNTGKYTHTVILQNPATQRDIPVQVRKDNTGLKQYKFIGWGKQIYTATGIDLLVDMNADYTCTVPQQDLGADLFGYGENVLVQDYASRTGQDVPSTYDPETGEFDLALIYFISLGSFGSGYEKMVMDKPITERDTVKVTADMEIVAEPAKGIIKVSAELNDTTFILEVVGDNPIGTFSLADGTLSQRYYYGISSAAGRSDFAEGEVTIAENGTGLKLNGLMIGQDEKAYVLDWTYTPITERDTVKVNLNAITIEEDISSTTGAHRGWLFEGQDTDTLYIVQVLGAEKCGTFSYADGTLGQNFYNIIPSSGQGRCQFTEGEVSIVEGEEGIKLTGLLIGEDKKAYVFNWLQPAGRLQSDSDVPFDGTFAYSDMTASIDNGVISISATNADKQTIGLTLYTDPSNTMIPAGTYVISDTKEACTALKSVGLSGYSLTPCFAGTRDNAGYINLPCWFMVDGEITLSYDEYGKLKVEVDAMNSYDQPVKALVQYVKIEPKSIVNIDNIDFFPYDGFHEQYGIMNFYGSNDKFYFDLYAVADTIVGDFLDVIDLGDCTIEIPNADPLGVLDASEFKVEADGKNLTLTAKLLASDTIQYNITATGYIGAIKGDAKEAYNGTFSIQNIEATQYSATQILITSLNEVGDTLALVVSGSLNEAGKIPAGVYTDVEPSLGWIIYYGFIPSFVMNAAEDAWFIQSGTLTVGEDGLMTFTGLNSYDKSVTINWTDPTSIEDINANRSGINARAGRKYIQDRKLIIVGQDGKKYGATGVRFEK